MALTRTQQAFLLKEALNSLLSSKGSDIHIGLGDLFYQSSQDIDSQGLGGAPAPISIVTSDPLSPIDGQQWYLYTPAIPSSPYTTISNTISLNGPGNLGGSGNLMLSLSGLTLADRNFLASINPAITPLTTAFGLQVGASTSYPSGITPLASGNGFGLGFGGWTLGVATIGDLVTALNAWVTANFHAGIGTAWTLSVPGDASVLLSSGTLTSVVSAITNANLGAVATLQLSVSKGGHIYRTSLT